MSQRSAQHIANLEIAYAFLEGLKNSGVVADKANPQTLELESENRLNMREWGEKTSCGTTACLGGWLTICPELRRQGLRAAYETLGLSEGSMAPRWIGGYGGTFEALSMVFGITINECSYVFGGNNLSTFSAGLKRLGHLLELYRAGREFDFEEVP